MAAVYTVAPWVRAPEEILPEHKRVWASLAWTPKAVEMFDEAARRDPKDRSTASLWSMATSPADGSSPATGRKTKDPMILIVDFIQVTQYVWKAAGAFFPDQELPQDRSTGAHLLEIVRPKASLVAAFTRRSATLRVTKIIKKKGES